MGFDAKLTLHLEQIHSLHCVCAPTAEELLEALEIVSFWEKDGGKSTIEFNGKMIDKPHYFRAAKVVAQQGYNVGNEEQKDANTNNNSEHMKTMSEHGSDTGSSCAEDQTVTVTDAEEIFPCVCMGKYFEDLEPGLWIGHFLTRTVTESDNLFFTCLTLNPVPIHFNHELSKGNGSAGVGKPLFNSMFTLALLVGMSVPEATHGMTVANLEFSEVLFPKPVYLGDTLRSETLVLDRRESKSRPSQGIVTLQGIVYNQRVDIFCKATRQALMKKKNVT